MENPEKARERRRRWREKNPDYFKKYRQKHKKRLSEHAKKYYQEHREQYAEQMKKNYQEHKEEYVERARKWQKENPKKFNEIKKRNIQKLRLEVFSHYSNGTPKCAHCGKTDIRILSIDHVYGGGHKHRKELGITGGVLFYRWLKKNKYPSGYRVLCLSCNHYFDFKRKLRTFNYRIHLPKCQCEGCDEDRVGALLFSKKRKKVLCKNCEYALRLYGACLHQNK